MHLQHISLWKCVGFARLIRRATEREQSRRGRGESQRRVYGLNNNAGFLKKRAACITSGVQSREVRVRNASAGSVGAADRAEHTSTREAASSHGGTQPRFISPFINKATSLFSRRWRRGGRRRCALLSSGFQSPESLLILDPLSLSSPPFPSPPSSFSLSPRSPIRYSILLSSRHFARALPPSAIPEEVIRSTGSSVRDSAFGLVREGIWISSLSLCYWYLCNFSCRVGAMTHKAYAESTSL